MRASQIEYWANSAIASVEKKILVEDSRIELKTELPPADHVARRLAGHANSSNGEPILWLIGVDERRGVVGVCAEDIANWWPAVKACFADEMAPEPTEIRIPHRDLQVLAVAFQTDRLPYVVKNPKHGKESGHNISLEVPWREGTAVRSAKRRDLLTLLVPRVQLPEIEVLGGKMYARRAMQEGILRVVMKGWVHGYVTPRSQERIVFPFHKASGALRFSGHPEIEAEVAFYELDPLGNGIIPTIQLGDRQLLVSGPGHLWFRFGLWVEDVLDLSRSVALTYSIGLAGTEQPLVGELDWREVPVTGKLHKDFVSIVHADPPIEAYKKFWRVEPALTAST